MKEAARLILLCVLCIFSAEVQAEITTHPQKNVKTTEGGNITLSCNATGNPEPTISWTKDGSPISSNSRISLSDNNKQLTITNVSRTDSGEYRCVANNSLGNDTSNSTTLDVKYPPEITAHPQKNITTTEGNNATLSCNATGNPVPTFSWTKDGSPIISNSRVSLSADNKQLTITSVNRTDSGEYRCVASNSLGNDTSNAATLNIQYQPEITGHPQNVTATEGISMTLSCNATGNPGPTILWIKNGSPLDASNNFRISLSDDNKQLIITNVSRTDSGEYRCVASNSIGNVTSNAISVDIKFKPEVTIDGRQKHYVAKGGNIQLTCRYNASPPVSEVQWIKNRTVIVTNTTVQINDSRVNIPHYNESQAQLLITTATLNDGGNYICDVTNDVNSTSDTTLVAIGVVSDPPKNVTVDSKGSRVVNISWTAGFDGNMAIQNYTLEISEDNQAFRDAVCQGSLLKDACVVSSTSASLESLLPWTKYYVRVFARNMVGSSGGSSIIKVTTDEEVPSRAPVLMDPAPLNSTTILVEWEPLDNHYVHGILTKYVIRYSDGKKTSEKTVARSRLEAVVNGLRQSTSYSFRVLAATVKGNGPPSEPKSATTKDPPIPPTPAPSDIGTTEVSVPFVVRQTLSNGKPVRFYQIIVLPLGKEEKPGKSSDENYINITRTYEDRMEGQPYITAEFANDDTQRTSFPVGDRKYYSRSGVTEARRKRREEFIKYLNGKLDEGKRYAVFQRSFGEDGDYQNEGFTRFKTIDDDKSVKGSAAKDDKDDTMTIAIVVPIVVVVVLGAGVFFCRRRNNSANNEEDSDQEIGAYDNHDVEGEIPVEEFEERVRRLRANNARIFSREYDALRPRAEFTCNASWAQENKHKNRYDNIVAYDHSRVKLTPVKGVPGSDYINANFLDGYQKKKAYIATQGPLEHTIGDFWRMVWEQGTKTIVMVANLGEKCHQYWPSEGAKSYGDIQVTLMQTVEHSEFTIRTMALKKANNSEQRTVHQYHYTTWPDHGVNPSSLLAFIRKASGANPPDAGPVVVHCSAGVGRTATFIAIDAMLRRMAAEKTADVFGYVMSLRRDRNFMVQSEEQYVLIHDVLVEVIHSGLTETRANDFVSHLNGGNQASGQSEMDEEFIPFQAANIVQDKIRNSYPNALPFDDTREVEGSEYMSADVIRGDMTRRAFIATQE